MAVDFNTIDPADLMNKDIFELLNLQNASEEDKKKIMDDMLETIQNRVIGRIFDALTDEDRETFQALTDKGDDNEVNDFLKDRGIDVTQITAEESLFYKTEILNITSKKETE